MPTRPLVSLVFIVITASCASAQVVPVSHPSDAHRWDPERIAVRSAVPDSGWHTVAGDRHGVSFFPVHRFPEVEYEAGERLTFDRYHSGEVINEWLRRWADRYPDLVELYQVAETFEGRPIMQVTLTNRATGSAEDRPAAFFEGGRHSGEITSTESVLWLLRHLLEGYGSDPEITELLDTKTLYIRPQNNPDGSALYLGTAQTNRSSVRPHDSDRDGLVDEDPPEDLDGDGIVYQLRWRVREGEDGNATLDDRDPSGRLMKSASGDEADWMLISEGVDNDGDGRYNEDGVGGLDLHRNYVENWRPEPGREATGRGQTQFGAGEYPLSEPETRSVVMWLLTHPNVSVANSMDTRVPMHLRPPSTSRSAERMYEEDLAYYEYFDELGLSITGYPWAGDVYETYATRYPTNSRGEPNLPDPLFGHGPDFGYWYYGSIWYGDELWNGGSMGDFNEDGLRDNVDALIWDDRENGGGGFRPWEAFVHPDVGEVEIGGFHPKFFSQNGPPSELEHWASRQALFNLEMAKHLPQLEIDDVQVERISQAADSAVYRVRVGWVNTGRLPTALRQAQLVKIVTEDQVELEFDDEAATGPDPRVRVITPSVRDKTLRAGWTEPGERKEAVFELSVTGSAPVEGTVHVRSTRGGHLRAPLRIGG